MGPNDQISLTKSPGEIIVNFEKKSCMSVHNPILQSTLDPFSSLFWVTRVFLENWTPWVLPFSDTPNSCTQKKIIVKLLRRGS